MDEKDGVISKLLCMACLCNGRNLYAIKEEKLRKYYIDALRNVPPEELTDFCPYLCWECHYIIQKAVTFKEKIQDSYLILKTYTSESLKANLLTDVTRSPRLRSHQIAPISIQPEDSKHELQMVLVKDELKSWEDDDHDYGDDLWTNESKCPLTENLVEIEIKTDVKLKKDKKKRKEKVKKHKKVDNVLKSGKKSKKLDLKEGKHIVTIDLSYEEMMQEREVESNRDKYKNSPVKCETCLVGFTSERLKRNHDDVKHPQSTDGYNCPVCNITMSSVDTFTQHYNRHMRRFECVLCHKRTIDMKTMRQHYYTSHDIACNEYKCHICGKISKSLNLHRYHRESHKSRVPCPECDKTFSHRAGLLNHRLVAHESQNKFPCEVCQKVFQWKTSLKRHMEIHEMNGKEKDSAAYCSPCGIGFAFVSSYQRHLKNSMKHVSQDQLKFICDHCKRRFADKTKLRDHIESKHMQKTFQCHICHKSSKNRVGLDQHIRNVHKGRPNDKICHHCGKGFPTKVQLECHIRTHTGERPFICEYCPTTFSQQSNLYKHNRQVHLNIKSKRYPPCKKKDEKSNAGQTLDNALVTPYKEEPISMQYTHDRGFII